MCKECQLKWAKLQKVKGNSYKFSKNSNGKKRKHDSLPLIKLADHPDSKHKGNIVEQTLHQKGLLLLEAFFILSNQH